MPEPTPAAAPASSRCAGPSGRHRGRRPASATQSRIPIAQINRHDCRHRSVRAAASKRWARCHSTARTGCSRGITPQGFILFLSPVSDRQLQNQHLKIAIMGQAERPTCPDCGAFLILALPPGGKGPRKMQCLDCDRPDPLKSEYVAGWLEGELRPPNEN
jgi:hypothetical protein